MINFKTKKQRDRYARLLPNDIPRKVRIYDNGGSEKEGGTFDRYTVVFTGNYPIKNRGWYDYLGLSEHPFHPQGFGQSGAAEFQPVDRPNYSHLGKKIKFENLPEDCKKAVIQDYLYHWAFTDGDGKPLK